MKVYFTKIEKKGTRICYYCGDNIYFQETPVVIFNRYMSKKRYFCPECALELLQKNIFYLRTNIEPTLDWKWKWITDLDSGEVEIFKTRRKALEAAYKTNKFLFTNKIKLNKLVEKIKAGEYLKEVL